MFIYFWAWYTTSKSEPKLWEQSLKLCGYPCPCALRMIRYANHVKVGSFDINTLYCSVYDSSIKHLIWLTRLHLPSDSSVCILQNHEPLEAGSSEKQLPTLKDNPNTELTIPNVPEIHGPYASNHCTRFLSDSLSPVSDLSHHDAVPIFKIWHSPSNPSPAPSQLW
jgi:hypothetical protein